MTYEEIRDWVKTVDDAIEDNINGEAIVEDYFTELSENSNVESVSAEIAFYCAENGYVTVLDLVIHNQPSVVSYTINGEKLMDFALRRAGTEVIEYLQEYGLQPLIAKGGTASSDSSESSIDDEQPQKRGKWANNIKNKIENVNAR